MSSEWTDLYFNSLKVATDEPPRSGNELRWSGKGKVVVIYYFPDVERLVQYVKFSWTIATRRPNMETHDLFIKPPHSLIPHLERAQANNRDVFVDFATDLDGKKPEIVTIATL